MRVQEANKEVQEAIAYFYLLLSLLGSFIMHPLF